jgi:hypothetical protein|tara:strand:- start:12265 stop:12600 length:336 start_codon:yes stop_codon:yes gene_type:complete
MRWLIILLIYTQTLYSQDFKDGISLVQFNASFLSENTISLEPIKNAETHLLLMGKHPVVFEKEKIVYLPTLILYHNGKEVVRVESDITLKLPDDSLEVIQNEIDLIIESKF